MKKMKKNNIWNRVFHKTELKENKKNYNIYLKQSLEGDKYIDALTECNSLIALMNIHKDIYPIFKSSNIGPDPYGYFRTDDILTMTPDQVYLGGIWGLYTKDIIFWEKHKGDKYGANGFGLSPDLDLYTMILNQYKNFLISNITCMLNKAKMQVVQYEELGY